MARNYSPIFPNKWWISLLFALFAASLAGAQTTPVSPVPITNLTATLPAYIGGGASFNQLGTPRYNFWTAGIIPISSSVGMFESTTVDLIPIAQVDSVTKRTVYTLQTSLREGLHKTLYRNAKNMMLVGGDAGLSFSQSSATGSAVTVNMSASFALTYIRQITSHVSFVLPIRGVWVPTVGGTGAWNFIPECGILISLGGSK
jgi:hypothetical protein